MVVAQTGPDKEPLINIGIILPGDRIQSVRFMLPAASNYSLHGPEQGTLASKTGNIDIELSLDRLQVSDGTRTFHTAELTISPLYLTSALYRKYGAKIEPAPTGRGFHWQRNLGLFLPGKLIVKPRPDSLLVINQVPLEQYIACVATSEMNATCPSDFIEAQTIAARSWMLANTSRKHADMEIDVCNDDCCQRYHGNTFLSKHSVRAASNTRGKVLMFEGRICNAYYSKNCGGMSESCDNVWPVEKRSYLPVRFDHHATYRGDLHDHADFANWLTDHQETFCSPSHVQQKDLMKYLSAIDEQGSYFRWRKVLLQKDVVNAMRTFTQLPVEKVENLEVLTRGGSGRVNSLAIVYRDREQQLCQTIIDSEYMVRRCLSGKFLYSSAISVAPYPSDGLFVVTGAGWGHGVGMCQTGALAMALQGYGYERILDHYYPGSSVQQIY